VFFTNLVLPKYNVKKPTIMDKINHRMILQNVARRAMTERGLVTDFPLSVLEEIKNLSAPVNITTPKTWDLRDLLWCSVDNADSLDLDQLSYARKLSENKVRVMVAIADVDALVAAQSYTDNHASLNTATVYTVAQIFPMLPEKLSTDLTSLRSDADRNAIVVDMVINDKGIVIQSDVYCALVRNRAKLVYESLAAWLDGTAPIPNELAKVDGLADNIRLQDEIAQKMRKSRYENGALEFETIESRPIFEGDNLREMKGERKNRSQHMIEEFMIASNSVTAQYLSGKKYPSLRRVVHKPKRWSRIIEIAAEHDFPLPEEANPKALSQYLRFVKQNFQHEYADLSLSVLKLLGAGEYIVETPDSTPEGHFGLAVKNYAHSTAPNRRYPDLITHRLLKSAMAGESMPYSKEQLELIARNCTLKEDDARKVERLVEKSAMAMLMESRSGEEFDAIVSGAADKGTWVRIIEPHLEGKLVGGFKGLEVGHKIRVRLVHVEIESGFIDFEKVG
jgi:exoribonuclease-2